MNSKQPAIPPGDWRAFHAGVACGIAGRPEEAAHFFDQFLTRQVDPPEWVIVAQTDAEKLKGLATNTGKFREFMTNRIRRARELQKLSALTVFSFDG